MGIWTKLRWLLGGVLVMLGNALMGLCAILFVDLGYAIAGADEDDFDFDGDDWDDDDF